MRGALDLAPLITVFHRGEHATESLDLAELIKNRNLDRALHCFHAGRTAQHVHGMFENARFLQQDRLAMRGEPDPLFARRRKRFVGTV